MRLKAAIRRVHRIISFVSSGASPAEWGKLGFLGFARDNPGSLVSHKIGTLRVRPRALHGNAVTVSLQDLGQLISFEEVFVQATYNLQLVPFEPAVVVDCGAHVGFFSALAGAQFPKACVIAFEPNPCNISWLNTNIEPLGSRGSIHRAAVSTYDGQAQFGAEVSNSGVLGGGGSTQLTVEVRDLERFLQDFQEDCVVLKIDIEGEERTLLPHILPTLPSRCALFVETHHGTSSRRDSIADMESAGFRVRQMRQRGNYADILVLRSPT